MQIILSTPPFTSPNDADQAFKTKLADAIETGHVCTVIIQRADLGETDYKKLIKALSPLIQSRQCAVLLDNSPDLVRMMGADGVHISTGHGKFIETANALQPDFIVGSGNIRSRHEAMLRGEAGADYVGFGDIKISPGKAGMELAQWWHTLFEIPCALFVPETDPEKIDTQISEFIGLGQNIWDAHNGPVDVLERIKKTASQYSELYGEIEQ